MLKTMNAVYRVDGPNILTSSHASGPWDPSMQHGSAPSALVTWLAEAVPTAEPMQISRVTIDLLRPVPVAPLTYETEILRAGRKIQLVGVKLLANGVVVVNATVLKIRVAALDLPPEVADAPLDVMLPEQARLLDTSKLNNAFVSGMSMRSVSGGMRSLGPGAVWYRLDRSIVEDAPISQVMRAVVASDFSNGTSSVLNFKDWTFINADLSVNLSRPPVGDWILLNAESWIGPNGAGIAASRLADINGYFGRAIQTLVIERRAPR